MTTIDLTTHSAADSGDLSRASSAAGWFTTSDHKRLGRLMIGCGGVGLVGVAVVSVVLGIARRDASAAADNAGLAPQLFALARVGLVFIAVLPLLLGVAVAVVPLQLGARAMAFPRLAAAGFWAWFFGTVLVVIAIAANGGPNGGAPNFVALFLSGFAVMLVGLTAVAGALATSILTTRAPGMNMRRMPLFSWSVLVTCLGLVLMLPVFGPSTVRDGLGRVPDYFSNPTRYADIPWETETGLTLLSAVQSRQALFEAEQALSGAYDRYGVMRDAWLQRREYMIYDGNPPAPDVEDDVDEEEFTQDASKVTAE